MNPNITKFIDQYLSGELSPEDTAVFEARMKSNPELRNEVALQQDIIDGAKRAARRTRVKEKAKKYRFNKLVRWSSFSAILVALATTVVLFVLTDDKDEAPEITQELQKDLDEKAQIENLEIQYFAIPESGKIVLSKEGVLLSVPNKAFLLNGKPYSGPSIVQYQEARQAEDIIKSGLSTTSGDRLLETQGMFAVAGYTPEGEALEFNPKVGVYVQAPVDELKADMQLFDGVKNADGSIDWQNPEPLEKIPVPIDMSALDFYPVGYEKLLDDLKWKKNKKSRDSLYLSFEESDCGDAYEVEMDVESIAPIPYPIIEGKITHAERDYLYGDDRPIDNNMTWQECLQLSKWKEGPRYHTFFKFFNDDDYDEHSSWDYDTDSTESYDVAAAASEVEECDECQNYILPSKVLSFWTKKFNNTNLSTHEFEKRMRAVHSTCNNAVLDKYTGQLSKSLSKIDAEVAAMGYPEFEAFAAEHVGAVNPDNPHLKGLQDFYNKGVKTLRAENRLNQEKERKRRKKLDKSVSQSRDKEVKRTRKRKEKALKEEYEYNLAEVKKQLGPTQSFTLKHGGGTVKNIDAYVFEATVSRTTTEITDPFTGKKAKITYNPFSVSVANPEKYIKLYTYVFSDKLKSYERIDHKNGKFEYNLNDFFIYDICVVGITEDGYEYFQKMTLKEGDLGTVKLEKITETKLEASIKQLNSKRGSKPMEIGTELDWLIKERLDFKEQKMRMQMYDFRNKIQDQIFPCCPHAQVMYSQISQPTIAVGL